MLENRLCVATQLFQPITCLFPAMCFGPKSRLHMARPVELILHMVAHGEARDRAPRMAARHRDLFLVNGGLGDDDVSIGPFRHQCGCGWRTTPGVGRSPGCGSTE